MDAFSLIFVVLAVLAGIFAVLHASIVLAIIALLLLIAAGWTSGRLRAP